MQRGVVLTTLAILVLAGCAQTVPVDEPTAEAGGAATRPVEGPRERPPVDEGEAPPPGSEFVPEGGTTSAGPPELDLGSEMVFSGTCDGACEIAQFIVTAVPEPRQKGWIDARVYWDGTEAAAFRTVLMLDGEEVGSQDRGFDLARTVHWDPGGIYTLLVEGQGAYSGDVRLRHVDAPALPGDDRLPNLVTLTPVDLYINNCAAEERVEDGAQRCLRLGNAVGNIGDGPLEVHLPYEEGLLSAAAMGRFTQRIYTTDGHRDVPASGAEVHPVHGHFHYAGLAHFGLYEHDTETGLRGDEVAVGAKRGFCFLDWGDMGSAEAPSEGGQRAEQDCLVPSPLDGWSMGISRGYYDYYSPSLADQYIDIVGVPDGTYELVSIADGADTLEESDETDNIASLIIRLNGDQVLVLEERSLYANPEGVP